MNLYDLFESKLNEFAPGSGGDSGNYFQELARAWYNGAYDSGSLQKGIKSQQDIERLLQRGIVGPDGVTRKYGIDYNSDFDGVVISSDDYYEHSDYNEQGQEVDSRTGQKWGPYDYMEFGGEELDESAKWRDPKYKGQLYTQEKPDYNNTREYDNARWNPKPKGYAGRKELPGGGEFPRTDPLKRGAGIGRSGIEHNINLSGKRKGLPSRDQITSLKQSIRDVHGKHVRPNLPEQGVDEDSLNELSPDLLQRSAQVAKNKSNQAMDPKIHDALGGGYMNPLAKHYDSLSQKFSNKAVKVGQRDAVKKIASPAVMRKTGIAEQGVAEGSEDPFGPQGRFVGDTGPAQITTTVARVQLKPGDKVLYKPTEQRATIEAMSRDGTQARIHIPSPMGGKTFNCKTSDLRPIGQGSLEEKSTSQAQFRTMAAAAHDPKFARKVGIKQSVAREFNKADKGQDYKSLPKKADEGKGDYVPPKEADYGDEYQAMVKRVGEKARAQEKAKQQSKDSKQPTREHNEIVSSFRKLISQ